MNQRPLLTLRHVIAPIGAAALLLAAVTPVSAQTALTTEAGFAGIYRPGRYMPLGIILDNQGKPVRAEVRARFKPFGGPTDEYRVPEQRLPVPTHRRYTLYVQAPPSTAAGTFEAELLVDGRSTGVNRVQSQAVEGVDRLVVAITGKTGSLGALSAAPVTRRSPNPAYGGNQRVQGKVQVAHITSEAAPDRWIGYDGVDMLVLGDLSQEPLSTEQQAALEQWVQAGGVLVVSGGLNPGRFQSEFFQRLLPIQVAGASNLSAADALAAFAKSTPPGAATFGVVTGTRTPDAAVLVSQGTVPLVAERRVGAGSVLQLAYDFASPPFRTWDGQREFWLRLLERAQTDPTPYLSRATGRMGWDEYQAYNNYGGFQQEGAGISEAPFAVSQLDIPSFWLIAGFLLAYIVCLVPVNYFVLRARDKKEWAWITTPAIVAVFSFGAYFIGYGLKGGRMFAVKVGVLEARAGQQMAPHVTYAGLFSPRKSNYDIGSPQTNMVFGQAQQEESTPVIVTRDEPRQLRNVGIDMWAMRTVEARGMVPLNGTVQANLSSNNGRLTGSVTNTTNLALDDCHIIDGRQRYTLGSLKPGETRDLDAITVSATGGVFHIAPVDPRSAASKDEYRLKNAVRQQLLQSSNTYSGGPAPVQPNDPVLVGWTRQPMFPLSVDGGPVPKEQNLTLVVVHLK